MSSLPATNVTSGSIMGMVGSVTDDIEYEPPAVEGFDPKNWEFSIGGITLTAKDDGTCTVRAGVEDYYLTSTTNVFLKTVTNLVYSAEDPLLVTGTNIEENWWVATAS